MNDQAILDLWQFFLFLSSAGIPGVHYHTWLTFSYFNFSVNFIVNAAKNNGS